jgi:hypothetical protein
VGDLGRGPRAGGREPGAGGGESRPEETAEGSAIACSFCGSGHTELFSLFGSSSLTSQYYCRNCRSVFERVKWGTVPPA